MKLIFSYPGLLTNKICYWSATNPTVLYERPLHSSKVTVWCAVSSFALMGPYFFEDDRERAVTVTGLRYVHMLENVLGPERASHPVNEETFFPTRWSYEPHCTIFRGSCEEFVS
jgi:hypothetical protein